MTDSGDYPTGDFYYCGHPRPQPPTAAQEAEYWAGELARRNDACWEERVNWGQVDPYTEGQAESAADVYEHFRALAAAEAEAEAEAEA